MAILLLSGAVACGAQSGQGDGKENVGEHTDGEAEGDSSSGNKDETEALSDYDALQKEQEQTPLETDEQIEEAILTNGLWGQILGERIYEIRRAVEDAADFCGEWKRTQIHTGTDGDLAITDQTSERFSFEMECYYFYHMGELSGDAWFVTSHLAIAKFEDFGEKPQYVAFLLDEESQALTVEATGVGFDLHLGNHVWVSGEYGKGEPVYTNEGQFEAHFSDELDTFMRENLSEAEYEHDFRLTAEIGVVVEHPAVLADGTKARWLGGYMPTDGMYSFEMLVTEDGRIYADMHFSSFFVTNDDRAESMPEWESVE